MRSLKYLFDNNKLWAERIKAGDPDFFKTLSAQQSPKYLWIGCSDSRVPANQIVDLPPGEVFVHRNVANLVVHTDLNCLSVLEFAVDVLKVEHIIVCGHYGCGGVQAALGSSQLGLIDNWLRNIKDVFSRHEKTLSKLDTEQARLNKLCELNVVEQVKNVCHTTIVQNAWQRGATLSVHGWIYDLRDGLLRDLNAGITAAEEITPIYRIASGLDD